MNMPVVEIDRDEAARQAEAYKEIRMPSEEEKGILAGYLAAAAGKKLVNLSDAMAVGGADERGWPRLAVANALAQFCYLTCRPISSEARAWWTFAPIQWIRGNMTRGIYRFESGLLEGDVERTWGSTVRAMVPIVPPNLRPRRGERMLNLSNYVVLWEVEQWERVPAPPGDPALLRHLHGELYTVEAEWDLTELERAVLAGRNR